MLASGDAQIGGEMVRVVVDAAVAAGVAAGPARGAGVRVEGGAVAAAGGHADPVVGVAARRVKVEDEDEAGALERHHLVLFVLGRHVSLPSAESNPLANPFC